ncbi:MAG: GntR family transcriptional regulator [Ardenticatenaceae bacterium]|nr:GntR family transcriptional regulator [Anaerolineales bacterium]MCB8976586.1 GntR family transcriptional regulator [Ardenticatenaceae bacterium]
MMQSSQPKPNIEQVEAALRQRIGQKVYQPGVQMPTELALTAEFGVSRATIRTVLTRLANEGLIMRRQGAGTYVNQRVGEVNTLRGLLDYGRLITESGYQPSIQPISMMMREATDEEAQVLSLGKGEQVAVLVRLFLADERPFILATNVIPQKMFKANGDFYDGRLPLHNFLEQYCHQTIAYAIYEICPRLADDEKTIQLLGCQPGRLLLQFTTTFYNHDNWPLVSGHSTYDDSVVKLRFMQSWV